MDLKYIKKIGVYKPMGIGDGLFGLIISSLIKKTNPSCTVVFIGVDYPKALIESHPTIDEYFIIPEGKEYPASLKEDMQKLKLEAIFFAFSNRYFMHLAKEVGIPIRVGFGDKFYTYLYCNYWTNYFKTKRTFHRKHKVLPDILLYLALDKKAIFPSENEIINLISFPEDKRKNKTRFDSERFKLVIHPGAQSAKGRRWHAKQFKELIALLDLSKFQIILTGNHNDVDLCKEIEEESSDIINLSGDFSLDQLKEVVSNADGLIAASTGPLHLASLMGKYVLGIYPSVRRHCPKSWGPLGKNSMALHIEKSCQKCDEGSSICSCIASIPVSDAKIIVDAWRERKSIDRMKSEISEKVGLWIPDKDLS